jgi:site-specific DNA recombinase
MKENSALPKSVGIWIRVSTEDQAKGESPEHHLQRARAYATAKGWEVKEVYDLAGISGKTVIGESEAKRMLADVKRGHIAGLIFSKLARLARNTRELLDFADYFRAHNADLISLHESIDTSTPAGRLFYTMIAAMAQWEREETVDRTKASIAHRAKIGSPLGGPAPFGYQWKDKKLAVDPKEAPIRKLMYELFVKHRRKKTVVRLLNEAGHRTRNGSQFTSKTVARLIEDPTAKGIQRSNHTTRNGQTKKWEMKPEADWVIHQIEAIVPPELWDECNAIIDETYELNRKPAQKPVHVFAGIAVCGCGEKMYVPSNSPKYVCRACRNKIPIVDLEAIFADELKDFAYASDRVAAYLRNTDREVADKEQLLARQRAELEKVRGEIKRLYDLYQGGKLDADGFGRFYKPLDERGKQLEADVPRLEAQVDVAKVNGLSAEEVTSSAQDLSVRWPTMPLDDKRHILEMIVERMTVGKGEIEITFCGPRPSEDMAKRWRKGWDSNPR